jgi:glutamate dehydrogenase
MSGRAEQLKADLIEKCRQRIHERLEPKRAAVVERFLLRFYANVPPDDIVGDSPDNLYGAALAMFGFAQQRGSDRAKVRVYNPRLEEHGWKSSHTIVEVVNDDMPFLVDSVTAELNGADAEVHLVIHPVIEVERDKTGKLESLHEDDSVPDGASKESVMHVQISEQPSERLEQIGQGLERVLSDVRASVEDWRQMRSCCRDIVKKPTKASPS